MSKSIKKTTPKSSENIARTEPNAYQGCPCIAHNVEAIDLDSVERGVPIEFGTTENEVQATNFSTLGNLWNGRDLTLPVTGIYYTEISFVRNFDATSDDVEMKLFARRPGGNPPVIIGSAWAGETSTKARQTAHYSIATKFEAGTELYLAGSTDGSRHAHIARLSWTTFHLCCNEELAVPNPC